MLILDYNRPESSAFVTPFNLLCVEFTSWSELTSHFIAYFTACKYEIIPGLTVVNLTSRCPLYTDTRY